MKQQALVSQELDLQILRCPQSGQELVRTNDTLKNQDGTYEYALTEECIPLFAEHFLSDEAKAQQQHYDTISNDYLENLTYPHTIEYHSHLDKALTDLVPDGDIGLVAEICCGRGETQALVGDKINRGVGVDISLSMLQGALKEHGNANFTFVQGDATKLPLNDNTFDCVFMLGGIHHINDREGLFKEVARILKPGGRFFYREPVSDFILWRTLRAIIYKWSPILDDETERPLLYRETVPVLEAAGMQSEHWTTFGFVGFCLFMNSDVLKFNKLFRFVPGIRVITRWFANFDKAILKLPGLKNAGLQVIGVARKCN